jgi:hypothetical protein
LHERTEASTGFKKVEQIDALKDNDILRFRKVKKQAASANLRMGTGLGDVEVWCSKA